MKKNILIALLIFGLGISGGLLLAKNDPKDTNKSVAPQNSNDDSSAEPIEVISGVKDMVSYTIPSELVEAKCASNDALYFAAKNEKPDCSASPDSAITLSIDDQNINDCNQLQNRSEVKKHICISLFINDQRSLQATTEYLESSSFGKEITSQEYYIDTGSGIVKAQYLYTGGGDSLQSFENLINSIKAK